MYSKLFAIAFLAISMLASAAPVPAKDLALAQRQNLPGVGSVEIDAASEKRQLPGVAKVKVEERQLPGVAKVKVEEKRQLPGVAKVKPAAEKRQATLPGPGEVEPDGAADDSLPAVARV